MVLSPDLVVPYSHQYNFSWEPAWQRTGLRLGLPGSRSPKLLTMWTFNRARPVPGIPQETDTVQERRPNLEYGELRNVLNGSFGYYDAARVEFILRAWKGLSFDTSYWFSKAIDLGANYTNTAAGRDAYSNVSQSEFDVHRDKKGLSLFDQPHSFLLRGTYELPAVAQGWGWAHSILKDWRLGSVVLVKSGTPFSVLAGSDSPDNGNVDGARGDRPNVLDPSVLGRTIGHPTLRGNCCRFRRCVYSRHRRTPTDNAFRKAESQTECHVEQKLPFRERAQLLLRRVGEFFITAVANSIRSLATISSIEHAERGRVSVPLQRF
jgi:hypothetical protein